MLTGPVAALELLATALLPPAAEVFWAVLWFSAAELAVGREAVLDDCYGIGLEGVG